MVVHTDSNPPSFTKQDVSQQRHLEEENVILKEELQRLTAQLAEISRLENDLKAAEREAKADEARQTVEIVSAENAQLGAHVQLLESELEAVQAGSLGRNLGSNENSPRGTEEHPLVFEEAHGVTPQAAAAEQGHEPAEEGASPAFSLIENSAYDQDGTGATRPSTAGSREDASSAADKEGMATAEKAEADFHFSSLKRKWHAEEGKYLAHELRRAQDLNVQQEMELESLRQQVAALSSEQLETLREKAAQADSAMKMAEKLQAEMALLQEQVETLHSRDNHVAELKEEAQAEAATLRQQLAELTTSLEEEKARFVLADNQLQASQAQQKELELDLQLKAQGDSELESALTEAKGKVAELLQLEDALRSKEEDVKMMSDQIAQQEAELTLLKRRKTDDDVEKQERLLELETSLQIAQDEREKAKAHAGAKEEEVVRLKGHVERAEQASHRSAAELEARLAAVASELDDAKVALADRERVCGELQMTSSGAEAEIASLKGQLKQLMDKLEAAIEASRAVPSVGGEAANGDADANQQSAAAQGDAEKELIELQKAVSLRDGDVEALKKQLEAASARADGHYAALQEINEQLQGIQRSHTEALQKSATAVQEKEQVAAEMEKMEKAHAAERHGLKEKLERLQRANKQRRGEIEEMQTKLSSMHQRASAYDQTFQELQQLRKENLDIKPLAAAHPQLLEEVSACRAEVKAAEKRIASFDALAKKAATVFEARLDGVGREKDQLLEQVAVLKSATVANEALQLQAAAAQRELTTALEAAAAAAAHQQRAVAAEKAAAEARKEAQVAQAAAAAMEERLQAAEEEMDRITGAVEEERARRAAAARAYAEELEGLPLKPVSSWPAPVRVLVRQREAAAAEAGAAGVRQEASAAEAALEAELEEARVARDSAEAEKRQAIAARDKAEAHTAGVSKELAEREECLGNLLRAARAEAAAASEEHQADIAELRHTLELRVATVRADVADWQV
ncbi:hypothetical protein COCSUDRAFT_41711 [Coccomyxa subellipsoidea C-169]|uniref:Uncharacterized protein n=1 Tax=Coccomyxa subellipsoidea (strain C-169) TaxID=574566 RepID=I0YYK2_COCSC|nr:hypothetical protein COCSUDRAFT_41711 [Coccomyxa subellipsoidea C-169]EIE23471.1 hypothetical protein COCSUDRAFT_41711 [Coccomyxa subellipsoidea C-169]|eukprot:XP_005648015.1 hypothetical protein COCSUDRAFT_41711 [Coccomyxa subellipsoidea C-169]